MKIYGYRSLDIHVPILTQELLHTHTHPTHTHTHHTHTHTHTYVTQQGKKRKLTDFDGLIVKGAPYGGLVATLRDPTKVYRLSKYESTSQRNMLCFYHSDDLEFLLSCPFNEESEIQNMGWSHDERLVCVLRDGTIVLIRPSASETSAPQRFQLPRVHNTESQVEHSVVFKHGVVVSTSNGTLVMMENFDRPRPLRLSALPLDEHQVTALGVVTRDTTDSSSTSHVVRVLVALSDGSVYSLTESNTTRAEILKDSKSPITHLQVAPRGHYVFLWLFFYKIIYSSSSSFSLSLSLSLSLSGTSNFTSWLSSALFFSFFVFFFYHLFCFC